MYSTIFFFFQTGKWGRWFEKQGWPAPIDPSTGQMRNRSGNEAVGTRSWRKKSGPSPIETSTGGTEWLQRVATPSQVQSNNCLLKRHSKKTIEI